MDELVVSTLLGSAKLFKRFVDDALIIHTVDATSEKILELLNSYDQDIVVTKDVQVCDAGVPFLDLAIK